ncbi:MAG: BMC domain-containing protein [Planctomycetota bacterium]
MSEALGFLQSSSIARGYSALDAAVKSAKITVRLATPISGGEFLLLFTGSVTDISSAVSVARQELAHALTAFWMEARPEREMLEAIESPRSVAMEALGVAEFNEALRALQASDRLIKTGRVRLIDIRLGVHQGGKGTVTFTGEVSQVESAMAALQGELSPCEWRIIPAPAPEVADLCHRRLPLKSLPPLE